MTSFDLQLQCDELPIVTACEHYRDKCKGQTPCADCAAYERDMQVEQALVGLSRLFPQGHRDSRYRKCVEIICGS